MFQGLMARPDLQQLASNPLILSMVRTLRQTVRARTRARARARVRVRVRASLSPNPKLDQVLSYLRSSTSAAQQAAGPLNRWRLYHRLGLGLGPGYGQGEGEPLTPASSAG